MDSSKLPWGRESQIALINKVREYPAIWDYENADFKKKIIKRHCYQLVCDYLKAEFPELQQLNADLVKSKFNHMRTYYQREARRIENTPSGSAGKGKSRWDYFHYCSYMQPTSDLIKGRENLLSPSKTPLGLMLPWRDYIQRMDSSLPWGKESQIALIEKVREYPAIWDYENADFKKKFIKRHCYQLVCDHLKAEFPELQQLNADLVKSKFNYMRTYYQKEVRRIENTPSGSAGKEESRWEYFHYCSYMQPTSDMIKGRENLISPSETLQATNNNTSDNLVIEVSDTYLEEDGELIPILYTSSDSADTPSPATTPLPMVPSLTPSPTLSIVSAPSPPLTRESLIIPTLHQSPSPTPRGQNKSKKRKRDVEEVLTDTLCRVQSLVEANQQSRVASTTPTPTLGLRMSGVIDAVNEKLSPEMQSILMFDLMSVLTKHAGLLKEVQV